MPADPSQGSQSNPVYFHVYNRGVAKQQIFRSDDNYNFFLAKVERYIPEYPISMVAYCLMPTHYHFLIETETKAPISRFIQKLFNSYTQALNRQQSRTGTLFESRVKFKLIETNEYALQLCRYIHLNPVEAKLVTKHEDWPYSNYVDWIIPQNEERSSINRFFQSPNEYKEFVLSSLAKG